MNRWLAVVTLVLLVLITAVATRSSLNATSNSPETLIALSQGPIPPLPRVAQGPIPPLPRVQQGPIPPLPRVQQGPIPPLPRVQQGPIPPLPR